VIWSGTPAKWKNSFPARAFGFSYKKILKNIFKKPLDKSDECCIIQIVKDTINDIYNKCKVQITGGENRGGKGHEYGNRA
jgi:hypothetical protein